MEIRDIVEISSGAIDHRIDHVLEALHQQRYLIESLSTRTGSGEPIIESEICTYPGRSGNTITTDTTVPVIQLQAPVHQPCYRYCRCQCHKSSSFLTPHWTRALVGSLAMQYNGTAILGKNPCDVSACRSGGKASVNIAYSFPTWLLSRAVSINASWGSLTNAGASLHLKVPRVVDMSTIYWALRDRNWTWLNRLIAESKIQPNDISMTGHSLLAVRPPWSCKLCIIQPN